MKKIEIIIEEDDSGKTVFKLEQGDFSRIETIGLLSSLIHQLNENLHAKKS